MPARGSGGTRSPSLPEAEPGHTARVGVAHEHEILRRGIASCLADDPLVSVVFAVPGGSPPAEVDVVVASPRAAVEGDYACPIVVFVEERSATIPCCDTVAALLSWPSTTM